MTKQKNVPMIIAHRGESYDAPENTLASINLAWKRNTDAVEIDVHLTKDNHVVAIHDKNTLRTSLKNQKIKSLTLEELKKLDVGLWKNKKWKGELIPTLKEILLTVPKEKKLIIEIKSDKKILPFLKNDLLSSNLNQQQIEIISFNYSTVVLAKKEFPQSKVMLLIELDYNWFTKLKSLSVHRLIEKVKLGNLDGLNAWAGKLLNENFIKEIKTAGLSIYCWTVNDLQHAKSLANWGIDAITTDRAGWLKEKLNN